MKDDDRPRNYRRDTWLTHVGRHPQRHHGAVNVPVYHASTILSATVAGREKKQEPDQRAVVIIRVWHGREDRQPGP